MLYLSPYSSEFLSYGKPAHGKGDYEHRTRAFDSTDEMWLRKAGTLRIDKAVPHVVWLETRLAELGLHTAHNEQQQFYERRTQRRCMAPKGSGEKKNQSKPAKIRDARMPEESVGGRYCPGVNRNIELNCDEYRTHALLLWDVQARRLNQDIFPATILSRL